MERVDIGGKSFSVTWSLSKNRNAWVRLKGEIIAISLPSRWPETERKRIGQELLEKAVRSIEKGKWKIGERSKLEFYHGQKVTALGKGYEVVFVPGKRFGARIDGGRIEVRVVEGHHSKSKKASALVKKRMVEALMPA
ncbi:MAG: hypothetical protein V1827_01785, partial [Candidatus Micrarchaeota archaeon]